VIVAFLLVMTQRLFDFLAMVAGRGQFGFDFDAFGLYFKRRREKSQRQRGVGLTERD
jgi:hypothetical protein